MHISAQKLIGWVENRSFTVTSVTQEHEKGKQKFISCTRAADMQTNKKPHMESKWAISTAVSEPGCDATSTERGIMGYPRLRPLERPDYWLTCSLLSKVTCLVHRRSPPEPNERDIIMWPGGFYSLFSRLTMSAAANYSSARSKVRLQGFLLYSPELMMRQEAGWEVKSADGEYRRSERGRKWLSGRMNFSS